MGRFFRIYVLLSVLAFVAFVGASYLTPKLQTETSEIQKHYAKRYRELILQFEEQILKQDISQSKMAAVLLFLGANGVGLIAFGYGLSRLIRKKKLIPQIEKLQAPWGADAAVRLLIIFFFSSFLVQFLLFETAKQFSGGRISVTASIIAEIIAKSLVFTTAFLLFTKEYGATKTDFGFRFSGRTIGYSIFIFFFSLPLLFLASYLWGMLIQRLGYSIEANPALYILMAVFEGKINGYVFHLAILLAVVVAPIAEEFIFRVMLYSAFKKHLGCAVSSLCTSFIFALLHPQAISFAPVFLLSLFLCYLYEQTASFGAVALMHAVHNGFQIAVFVLLYCLV